MAHTPLSQPVLTRRIPSPPFGRIEDRKLVTYEQYVATDGYKALRKAIETTPADLVKLVKDSQLRGRGGAGFSTGLKWSFLPPQDGKPRYLAINCDEAEPGTFKDRLLVDFDPHIIIEGIAICMRACQLDTAYFYIRGEYHKQAKTMQKAIDEAYANKIFGPGSIMGKVNDRDPNLYLHRGAGAYICGEETGLLESIEGKRGWPRIKPPFPAVAGLFGRPTIINNVETLAKVTPLVTNGADWFKSLGSASSLGPTAPGSFGTKLFGISGHVNFPHCFEENLGIKLSTVIEKHCGGMRGGKKYKGAIPGGISMGILGTDQYEAELDFDIGRKCDVLGLGTAGVIVMDESTDMVAMARNIVRFFSHESCGQCTPCREGSAWIRKILDRMVAGDGKMKDIAILEELACSMGAMPGTTICGLADGTNWAVRTMIKKFRGDFEKACKPSFVQVGVNVGA